MDKSKIQALISLLDDPDDEIYKDIKFQITNLGNEVIPFLEEAWENNLNSLLQKRAEEIIHEIQFGFLSSQLKNWAENGGRDLLEGAMLVSRYQYPDLEFQKIIEQINKIKEEIWLELNPNLTALENVRIINHILFQVHGFAGNTSNFHSPQNSYINNVIESKKGNPLSLSIIYTYISQKLEIDIRGVNLPEHFILAYMNKSNFENSETSFENVLFYINPFSKGTVFSRKDIDQFLSQLKLPQNASYYLPCTNIQMIQRLLRNLHHAYEKSGNKEKVEEIEILLKIIEKFA